MLKHGILGLLNYGDATGYDIMLAFRKSLSHFWVAQTSQIYRELQVLEDKGWIKKTLVEQDGRPDKNVLSITDDGKSELLRWLREDEVIKTVRSPMLMKTFFRGECSIDENIEFFKRLAECINVFPDGQGEAFDAKDQYEKMIDNPERALFWKFTIDFGIMYEKMLLEWSNKCIQQLEGMKNGQQNSKCRLQKGGFGCFLHGNISAKSC